MRGWAGTVPASDPREEWTVARRGTAQGYQYRPGVQGKFHFRVREQHIADIYVPLLAGRKAGAVKLDLVLRGLALLPAHAGRRQPGQVLPNVSYEHLHDLCRVSNRYRMVSPEDEVDDPAVLAAKRNWVGKYLAILEEVGAVERGDAHRGRPIIVVNRDHGDGPFDDPDGSPGSSYVTISGPVLARWLPVWRAPEVAAYLAAMVADRYARLRDLSRNAAVGGATWFEVLDWFEDPNGYRPADHVRIPFAVRTLERGFARLKEDGLVEWHQSSRRPDQPGRRFRSGRRNIYTNRFDAIDAAAEGSSAVAAVDEPLVEKD